MMKHRSYAVLAALAVSLTLHAAAAKTLHFAGLDWTVKEGDGLGPGPCDWKESNVFVDSAGDLHLKIARDGGSWSCAEVESVRSLGFGTYQWWVTGEIGTLDPNVVLGLFNYPPPEVGPDGTNEIDIEIAKWGIPDAPNLNFTVWPARAPIPPAGASSYFSLGRHRHHAALHLDEQEHLFPEPQRPPRRQPLPPRPLAVRAPQPRPAHSAAPHPGAHEPLAGRRQAPHRRPGGRDRDPRLHVSTLIKTGPERNGINPRISSLGQAKAVRTRRRAPLRAGA